MDINLDQLKPEILEHLASEDFVVFRSLPGGLDGHPMVFWDAPGYPDYRSFVHVAKQAGAKMMLFAHRDLYAGEVDDALEMLKQSTLSREERRSLERGLDDTRDHIGSTCTLEISFGYEGRMFVFELVTEWFSQFMDYVELLEAATSDDDDDEEERPPLGGYFSKN